MPRDPSGGDDVEARLRRALAEHAEQAPSPGLVEQRILAASRRGDARSRRPRWLSVTALRPLAVAASVLVVVGATLGGVALVNGLHDGGHAGAGHATTPSATATVTPPTSATSSTATVSSSPAAGTSESSTNGTPSEPTTGNVPPGFTVSDLTFVGTRNGWALGTAPTCAHKPCTSLVRTTDGGQNWVGLAPPVVGLAGVDDCTTKACVSGVRFASKQVGYLFGPRIIYLTTDGGANWRQIPGGAEALEIADGNVLRVTTAKPGCTPPGCAYLVQTSGVADTTWTTVLTTPSTGSAGVGLVRAGAHAFVQVYGHVSGGGQSAHSALYVSSDDGQRWTSRGEPCPQLAGTSVEYDASAMTPTPAGAIVVLCTARGTDPRPFLATSSDGSPFAAGTPTAAVSAPIGAASTTVVFAQSATGSKQLGALLRSRDGGATFARVARSAKSVGGNAFPGFLGFENASTGRWVSAGDPSTVWTTTDAGAHWTAHTFA